MPSHRQRSIPRHRAGRPQEHASRPASLHAGDPAKRIAPGPARDRYQPGPGPGIPAPAAGRATARWKRGLLVTPWFAAGAGFVIAAALSLNSPRTFLTYRPTATPRPSTCADCQPGALASARPGVQIKVVHPDPAAGRRARALPAVPVRLGPEVDGRFSVTFLLPASQAGHPWKLRFELPGRSVTEVVGAQWRPEAGGDGGLAAAPGQDQYVSPLDPAAVSFLVTAGGAPVAPSGCQLDGRPCSFS